MSLGCIYKLPNRNIACHSRCVLMREDPWIASGEGEPSEILMITSLLLYLEMVTWHYHTTVIQSLKIFSRLKDVALASGSGIWCASNLIMYSSTLSVHQGVRRDLLKWRSFNSVYRSMQDTPSSDTPPLRPSAFKVLSLACRIAFKLTDLK